MKKVLLVLGILISWSGLFQADMLDDINNSLRKSGRGLLAGQISAWINKLAKSGIKANWNSGTRQFERIVTGVGTGDSNSNFQDGSSSPTSRAFGNGAKASPLPKQKPVIGKTFLAPGEVVAFIEEKIAATPAFQDEWNNLQGDPVQKAAYDKQKMDITDPWGRWIADWKGKEKGLMTDSYVNAFFNGPVMRYAYRVGKFNNLGEIVAYLENKIANDTGMKAAWNKLQNDPTQKSIYDAAKLNTSDPVLGTYIVWYKKEFVGKTKSTADQYIQDWYDQMVKYYAEQTAQPQPKTASKQAAAPKSMNLGSEPGKAILKYPIDVDSFVVTKVVQNYPLYEPIIKSAYNENGAYKLYTGYLVKFNIDDLLKQLVGFTEKAASTKQEVLDKIVAIQAKAAALALFKLAVNTVKKTNENNRVSNPAEYIPLSDEFWEYLANDSWLAFALKGFFDDPDQVSPEYAQEISEVLTSSNILNGMIEIVKNDGLENIPEEYLLPGAGESQESNTTGAVFDSGVLFNKDWQGKFAQYTAPEEKAMIKLFSKNYFELLGIPEDFDFNDEEQAGVFRKAFRKISMQYHPDRYFGKPNQQEIAVELIKYINFAKDVLIDVQKRNRYETIYN